MGKYTSDIAGYLFDGVIYCPSCIRSMAAFQAEANGMNSEYASLDTLLVAWSENVGIDDLDDESSYDSADFPKMILATSLAVPTDCERCEESLTD